MANTNLLQQWQQLQNEYSRLQSDFISFGKYIEKFGEMFGNVGSVSVSNVTPITHARRRNVASTTHRRGRKRAAA
jgi:hypothetical protein